MTMRQRRRQSTKTELIPYSKVPAKSFTVQSTTIVGRMVEEHCWIVGEVARELISRSSVASLFPKGSAFTAATHDIGKVSPTFYNKIMRACGQPQIEGANPDLEKEWGGHAGVSQLTAKYLEA